MGQEYYYRGSIPVSDDLTFDQVRDLWDDIEDDGCVFDLGEVQLDSGFVNYAIIGYSTIGFGDEVEDFLTSILPFTTSGWVSYESEDGEVVFRGKDPRAVETNHWLDVAKDAIERAARAQKT